MLRRAGVLGAALLLVGCTAVDEPHAPLATPLIPITHPHALLSCPDVPAVRLDDIPDDIVEVRRCTADFHDVEGVLNKVQYVERLTSDPDELLVGYSRPDDPPAEACDAEQHDTLILWLELSWGETVAVRAPVDGCLAPLETARVAYDAAEFETILVAREVASTLDG